MTRLRLTTLLAIAMATLFLATACSGNDGSDAEGAAEGTAETPSPERTPSGEAPDGFVTIETEHGTIAHPPDWEAVDDELSTEGHVARVMLRRDGEAVGQLDVLIDEAPPGSQADALNASNQGARSANLPDLRSTRQEYIEVPGAASAFLDEGTYTTADGVPAHTMEVLAVSEEGHVLLARITGLDTAWDPDLAQTVLDTLRLDPEASA